MCMSMCKSMFGEHSDGFWSADQSRGFVSSVSGH